MTLALTYQPTAHYLTAAASGCATLEDIFAAINAIATVTRTRGSTRLLIDLREVQEEFRFADHFAMGDRVAAKLAHLQRVASLVREPRRTGTSEQVARQRGMLLRVFVAEADAISWLSEPDRCCPAAADS